ncbi:alpha-L-fucosidase [Halococcus agarilyticus]|uniref:alpha-L-fucosidase n=1 Tax=Halococcus agarilyticus TaxID=1232219 RepID=UPI000677B632|nr:alpha-L-fucosidase [Halococcus agarilyticus]
MATYRPEWESLESHSIPTWFKDSKFGVYFHWGPYSVPAHHNEWYPRNMYREGSDANEHHTRTYGDPSEHGYREFIPEFTGEAFDAERWVDLCEEAGAEYVGVTAMHHDGFALWDSDITEWNAVEMGPERDIVGELAEAVRDREMKFVAAFHHAFRWWYFPREEGYDTMDPEYAGLYGDPHEEGEEPPEEYYEEWRDLTNEVVDEYRPDLIWFDFAWGFQPFLEHDEYRRQVVSHYYNEAEKWGKEVDVAHKRQLPPGVGVVDHERSRREDLSIQSWLTDTSVDRESWGYVEDADFKSAETLVTGFVDRLSKNGNTLLNVGPRPDGTVPDEPAELLRELGDWFETNGESVFGARPGWVPGEGPTEVTSTEFEEASSVSFTPEDKRFLRNGETYYVALLDWPEDGEVTIETPLHRIVSEGNHSQPAIERIDLVGGPSDLNWHVADQPSDEIPFDRGDQTLSVDLPSDVDLDHAYVLRLSLASNSKT